jgi:hypothetical protein
MPLANDAAVLRRGEVLAAPTGLETLLALEHDLQRFMTVRQHDGTLKILRRDKTAIVLVALMHNRRAWHK